MRQAYRRLSEWIELQFSQIDFDPPNVPDWSWLAVWGRGLFWGLVIGLGLWLSLLLYRAITYYIRKRQGKTYQSIPKPQVTQQRTAAEWWREANFFAQKRDYRQACRALYMATLQKLHDSKRIMHNPSRTDGEYLQVVSHMPGPRPYQLLIRTHERAEFGDAVVSEESYERCQQAYREIERV